MTKKPVKIPTLSALWAAIKNLEKQLSALESHIGGQLIDIRHRMSSLGARLDGVSARTSMYSPGLAEELTAEAKALLNKGQFCVIGDVAKSGFAGHLGRTWKATQAQAEAHAESIHRNHPSCPELLVVKVVSKVGRREPDIKITRV